MQIPLLGHWVDQWAVGAQQRSRRNAMIATNELARLRAERLEVEHFLQSLEQRSEVVHVAVAR